MVQVKWWDLEPKTKWYGSELLFKQKRCDLVKIVILFKLWKRVWLIREYLTLLIANQTERIRGNFKMDVINSIIILQTYVPTTGPTLKDTVTEKCLPVILGAVVKENVQFWVLIFPVSTIKKKMSMFKTSMAESILGWASLISTLKERLCGVMELLLISITGQATNQTTSKMRTVFIPSGFFVVMSTSGMMSIALTVTSSLAKKVLP